MPLIDISKITIDEDRIRRTFDPHEMLKLKDSVKKLGLLQPIVVRTNGDGLYRLSCGERRLRTITALHQEDTSFIFEDRLVPRGYIPAVFLNELSEEQQFEAELEENTHRVNLTWQEITEAQARLHAWRLAHNPQQTFKATAQEIHGDHVHAGDQADVAKNVFLAQYLNDPEVAKAKTQKEAYNIASKKASDIFQQRLAEMTKGSITAGQSLHTLYHEDSLTFLPKLVDAETKFDVIITDPPYGIDADTFDTMSESESGLKHEYKDDIFYAMDCYRAVAEHGYNVTKPDAHAYIFFDMRYYHQICEIFNSLGWNVHQYPIIWDKTTGMLGDSTRKPRRTYETILFCTKGDKKVTGVYNDVIRIPQHGEKVHAAEKPVELYVDLLRRSCFAGDTVLDCFCGSGTVFPAANELSLRATGIEKSASSHAIAFGRLSTTIA